MQEKFSKESGQSVEPEEDRSDRIASESNSDSQTENGASVFAGFTLTTPWRLFLFPLLACLFLAIIVPFVLLTSQNGVSATFTTSDGSEQGLFGDSNGSAVYAFFSGADLADVGFTSAFSEIPPQTRAPLAPFLVEHFDESFRSEPMVDLIDPNLEVDATQSELFVRLGDSVMLTSVDGFTRFGASVLPGFFGNVGSVRKFRLADKTRDQILRNAMLLTILKADDLEINRLSFLDNGYSYSREYYESAFFDAFDQSKTYLRSLQSIEVHFYVGKSEQQEPRLEEYQLSWWDALQRTFGTRQPIENREALFPVRVGQTSLIGLEAENLAEVAAAQPDLIFAPEVELNTDVTYRLILAMGLFYYLSLGVFVFWNRGVLGRVKPGTARWLGYALVGFGGLTVMSAVTWFPGLLASPQQLSVGIGWQKVQFPVWYGLPSITWILGIGLSCLLPWVVLLGSVSNAESPLEKDERNTVEKLKATLISDRAIDDVDKHDKLGFRHLVLALEELIDNKRTEPPLVLSINGPWGSGKTSVMRMLESRLKGTKRFHFAWFNAWQYRDESEILPAFLRQVAEQLRRDLGILFYLRMILIRWRFASDGRRAFLIGTASLILLAILFGTPASSLEHSQDLLGIFSTSLGVVGVGGGLWSVVRWIKPFQVPLLQLFRMGGTESVISPVEQFNKEFLVFREALAGRKFVVFIDDLDRCAPEALVEVLKAVNLIADRTDASGKTFFVLGFDWEFILNSIEMHFAKFTEQSDIAPREFSREYLKKIVTLPVSIPEPNMDQIGDMVSSLESNSENNLTPSKTPGIPQDSKLVSILKVIRRRGDYVSKHHALSIATIAIFFVMVIVFFPRDPGTPGKLADAQLNTSGGFSIHLTGEISNNGGSVVVDKLILKPHTESEDANSSPSPQTEATSDAEGNSIDNTSIELVGPTPIVSATASGPTSTVLDLLWFAALIFTGLIVVYLVSQYPGLIDEENAEPDDDGEFTDAVLELKNSLPQNPRDIVRLLNVMRLAFLLQTNKGTTLLSADESIRASLWCYRFGDLIDPERLRRLVPEMIDKDLMFDPTLALIDEQDKDWIRQIQKSVNSIEKLPVALSDFGKLKSVLSTFANLLKSNGTTETEPDEVEKS